MKVKCGIILNAVQVINELAEKPMKISLAAKLLRLSDDLQKESDFVDKQRRTIIEKYGKKDENGELIINEGNITFEGENANKVQEEFKDLSELELEITDRNITQKDLEDNNIELTLSQLAILENFYHKEENLEVVE